MNLGQEEKEFLIVIVDEEKLSMDVVYAVIVAVTFLVVMIGIGKWYCRRQNKPRK